MGTDDLAFRLTHPLAKGPATMSSTPQRVQCFGKKKTATAVAQCKAGKGLVKVNGRPLQLVQPEILRQMHVLHEGKEPQLGVARRLFEAPEGRLLELVADGVALNAVVRELALLGSEPAGLEGVVGQREGR